MLLLKVGPCQEGPMTGRSWRSQFGASSPLNPQRLRQSSQENEPQSVAGDRGSHSLREANERTDDYELTPHGILLSTACG
jgi:hypothetical protein